MVLFSIAGGIGDGSIQIWNLKPGWRSGPDIRVEKAHSYDITGLRFASDNRHLISKSFDGTLKMNSSYLRERLMNMMPAEGLKSEFLVRYDGVTSNPDELVIVIGQDIERLVRETVVGFSGIDMQALCEEAAMMPIRELGSNILTVKANQFRPLKYEGFRNDMTVIRPSLPKSQWEKLVSHKLFI